MRPSLFLTMIFAVSVTAKSQESTRQPGYVGITFSLPWVNSYIYYDYDKLKSSSKSGFVGLGASFFYKTGINKFSLNFGLTGDLPVPIGAFDYGKGGTRANIGTIFGEMIYHREVLKDFGIISGLNFVMYRFNFTSYVDTIPSYITDDNTLGITIGGEYRFTPTTSLALFYRPAIVSLGFNQYRHLISLDARFDLIPLRKK